MLAFDQLGLEPIHLPLAKFVYRILIFCLILFLFIFKQILNTSKWILVFNKYIVFFPSLTPLPSTVSTILYLLSFDAFNVCMYSNNMVSFYFSPGSRQPRSYIQSQKKRKKYNYQVLAPTPSPPFWSKTIILKCFITLPYPTLGLLYFTVDMISLSLLYMIALTVEKYCLDIPCVL